MKTSSISEQIRKDFILKNVITKQKDKVNQAEDIKPSRYTKQTKKINHKRFTVKIENKKRTHIKTYSSRVNRRRKSLVKGKRTLQTVKQMRVQKLIVKKILAKALLIVTKLLIKVILLIASLLGIAVVLSLFVILFLLIILS